MKTEAEAIRSFEETIEILDRDIAALERFFSVTCIDAWPFVIVLEQGSGNLSALKVLSVEGDTARYNFSASGRDASQYSRKDAQCLSEDLQDCIKNEESKIYPMGKREFFQRQLDSKRESRKWIAEEIAKRAA